jgi:micrococcal nuclease
VKAEGHDIEIKVRLVGIDAPEISRKKREPGQSFSYQAKEFLADLVLNKPVDIKGYGLDRYNHVLGVIYLFGTNINIEMVRAGLAEVYRGKPPYGFDLTPYWEAEKEAKEAKKNMWSQGDKYISPKEWRRMLRGK